MSSSYNNKGIIPNKINDRMNNDTFYSSSGPNVKATSFSNLERNYLSSHLKNNSKINRPQPRQNNIWMYSHQIKVEGDWNTFDTNMSGYKPPPRPNAFLNNNYSNSYNHISQSNRSNPHKISNQPHVIYNYNNSKWYNAYTNNNKINKHLPRKSPIQIPRGFVHNNSNSSNNVWEYDKLRNKQNYYNKHNSSNSNSSTTIRKITPDIAMYPSIMSGHLKQNDHHSSNPRSWTPNLQPKDNPLKLIPSSAKSRPASKSPNWRQNNENGALSASNSQVHLNKRPKSSYNMDDLRNLAFNNDWGGGVNYNDIGLNRINNEVSIKHNHQHPNNINVIKINWRSNLNRQDNKSGQYDKPPKESHQDNEAHRIGKHIHPLPNNNNNNNNILINHNQGQTNNTSKPDQSHGRHNPQNKDSQTNDVSHTGNKNRSNSTSMPEQFSQIVKNKNYEKVDKKQETIDKFKKKIRNIFTFTHVGFDGEEDKEHNQDIAFIEKNFAGNPSYYYWSVCDGHGVEGHEVSGYIKKILPKDMSKNLYRKDILTTSSIDKKNIHAIISNTFVRTNEKLVRNDNINSSFSGSTCVSLIYTPVKLICPNIGDSRAVIGKYVNNKWVSHDLSRDHKPTELDEAKRIIENKGRIHAFTDDETGQFVGPQRVWIQEDDVPGWAMTRSFGDRVAATVGVCSVPEIWEYDLTEEDKFIILASDGVWEFIESKECVNIIKDFYLKNDMEGCCEYLYRESRRRWIKEEQVVDDITMILVFLD